MATFYNQATLSYGNVIRNSNITEGELLSGITVNKAAITGSYGAGDSISYVVTLINNGTTDITGITLTDDLGTYTVPETTTSVTPLTYAQDSVLYYLNGVLQTAPTVVAGSTLAISGLTIPAGGNATVIYETTANEYAPLSSASSITNTVTVSGTVEELSASATVDVREEALLSIAKAVCPTTVAGNGELTYTFIIQNSGNAVSPTTDNVIVSDTFTPILNGITVTLDGVALAEGTGYTYNATTGAFSTVAGVITVPAATFTTDTTTSTVVTTPGVATLTVSGTV